jgi:hypothetical protein
VDIIVEEFGYRETMETTKKRKRKRIQNEERQDSFLSFQEQREKSINCVMMKRCS